MQGVGTLGNGIAGEHTGAAGTVAQSHDGGIQVEIDMLGILLQVAVVGGGKKMFHTVGKSREGEGLVCAGDAPALAFAVGQFQKSSVVVVAAVLRTGVVHILLADCRFPQPDGGGGMAVGIVVPGSAAKIG